MAMLSRKKFLLVTLSFFVYSFSVVFGDTDPSDQKILEDFRKGLENPELLNWPDQGDPCGPPSWPHVFCIGSRVSQIQVQNLSLKGPLPQNFNKLSKLYNIGLQRNQFTGKLPSFSGLSELQYAYLGYNNFDTIPLDFFNGLDKLEVLSLDYNPLNESGWQIPLALQNSAQLMNLSLMKTNLAGPLPDFLGTMSFLTALKLSFNNFSGPIPASYSGAQFQVLWLNGQSLTGPIDPVGSMLSLQQLWLHNNQFTGTIPAGLANCTSLVDLQLYNNQLVGPIPEELTSLQLKTLLLNNNKLTGPIPEFKVAHPDFSGNSLCQTEPGVSCSAEVNALLDFLGDVGYPVSLASSWSGNDPCTSWLGIACAKQKVSVITLPHFKLNGTLSPSVGKLDSLVRINLGGNNLTGSVPQNYTDLKSLSIIDLSNNNLKPPVPSFRNVKVVLDGNPLLTGAGPTASPTPGSSPKLPIAPPGQISPLAPGNTGPPSMQQPSAPGTKAGSQGTSAQKLSDHQNDFLKNKLWVIIIPIVVASVILILLVIWCVCRSKLKEKQASGPPFVVHPRDSSNSDVKIVIANQTNRSSPLNPSGSQSRYSSTGSNTRVFESGNLVISVQVLRDVTNHFAPENELGRGGFGTVYKGELEDGTVIAVKRMESSAFSSTALDEFQSEIAVLSKVRHRHLVSLLGYSIEGYERLLVYEYVPQGALSKHLFQWKVMNLEPLSWKRRLIIALDVARGMEYLHSLAQHSFIHRDLKSSNILLGDDFRAKVSDFGLVKLAPDGKHSVATRLAGTFGYLAPEYAVMGKVTTKADVFSFGVVLMELVTGLTALDEDRAEDRRYLAEYFWRIKSSKELLRAAVDPTIEVNEETTESICIIAELAGHCTARDPYQRPDMSHAVSVLASLVEKWKPMYDEREEFMGIDCSQPLRQMVQVWQASDDADSQFLNLEDSKGSIPPAPTGFADSFTSNDAR